jgi:ketosteroid isomerase-like protein
MRPHLPLALVALAGSLTAQAGTKDVQATLQAKYDLLSKAFAKKDARVYEKTLSPDFVLVGLDGKQSSKKVVMEGFTQQMSMMTDVSWVRKLGKPTVSGSTATVLASGNFKGKFNGGGKVRVFELIASSQDTWKKNGSDWVLVKSKLVTLNAKIDGKSTGTH